MLCLVGFLNHSFILQNHSYTHIITLSLSLNLPYLAATTACLKPKRNGMVLNSSSLTFLSSQVTIVKTEGRWGGEQCKCSSTSVAKHVSLPSVSVLERSSALNNYKASASIHCKHKPLHISAKIAKLPRIAPNTFRLYLTTENDEVLRGAIILLTTSFPSAKHCITRVHIRLL